MRNRSAFLVTSFVAVALIVAAGAGFAQGPSGIFWRLTGNGGTNSNSDFLGTTDNQDLVFKVNGSEVMRFLPDGRVGVGTANPGFAGIPEPLASVEFRNVDPFSTGETNVLISSDTGQAFLQLLSVDQEAGISLFSGSLTAFDNSIISVDRNTGNLNFCVNSGSHCIFSTDTRLSIEPSGNVGVGTTTPRSALQVIGYTQLDVTSGLPPFADCDEPGERGRMKVDSPAGLLWICADAGWIAK